jgi:hypothetical protein
MQIIQSNIRRHPRIMWTVLLHTPTLDPLTILTNRRLLLLKDSDTIASFIAVKDYGSHYEL